MNLPIRLVFAAMLLIANAWPASAQDAVAIAQKVPVEINEIVSGGIWSKDGKEGVYRAVAVLSPSGETTIANVIVQLLALENGGTPPTLVNSIVIKEVAEKKFSNAFVGMTAESEKGMTLIITSYDPANEEETTIFVKFDGAGNYEIASKLEDPLPPLESILPPENADQKN